MAEQIGEPLDRVSHTAMNLSIRSDAFFRAKLSHKVVRWFDTKERAEKFQGTRRAGKKRPPSDRAWWGRDAEPYYPPGIKVQRIPTPPVPAWTNTHARW